MSAQDEQPGKHGAVAIISDEQGRYLFIQRGLTLSRAPGVWCFVGGEVEPDEPIPAAVEREVFEEVGLRVRAREKVFESISPNGEFLLHWYRVDVLESLPRLNPNAQEVERYRWLTPGEGAKLEPILPTVKDWLERQVRSNSSATLQRGRAVEKAAGDASM